MTSMSDAVRVEAVKPTEETAVRLVAALWEDIQQRYSFRGENDMPPEEFSSEREFFLVATVTGQAAGCAGLHEYGEDFAELNAMYVAPKFHGSGVARALIAAFEKRARELGYRIVRLRAGGQQPEALRFYQKHGFYPIECFGKYADSSVSLCFEKAL